MGRDSLLEACKAYDPDNDVFETGGKRGPALASAILNRAGGFDAYFLQRSIHEEAPVKTKRRLGRRPKPVDYENNLVALERIYRISSKLFPELDSGERLMVWEIKDRLGELVQAGCSDESDIPKGYRNMQRGEAYGCLERVQSKMELLAKKNIQGVYAEIKAQNQRFKEEAELFR